MREYDRPTVFVRSSCAFVPCLVLEKALPLWVLLGMLLWHRLVASTAWDVPQFVPPQYLTSASRARASFGEQQGATRQLFEERELAC